MNTGIIAARYATALLRLVDETGSGEAVVAQVQTIGKALDEVPGFRRSVNDPAVSAAKKVSLFEAALSPVAEQTSQPVAELVEESVARQAHQPATEQAHQSAAESPLTPELRKFVELLIRNGRIGDVRLVFTTFITEYFRSRHIKRARLVVADPELLDSGAVEPAPGQAAGERIEPSVGEPVEPPTLESRLRSLIKEKTGCGLILKTEVNPSLIGGFVFEVEDTVLDASVSRQLDIIRRQFIEKNRRIV